VLLSSMTIVVVVVVVEEGVVWDLEDPLLPESVMTGGSGRWSAEVVRLCLCGGRRRRGRGRGDGVELRR